MSTRAPDPALAELEPIVGAESGTIDVINENVPLPGSVSGRRIVKLEIAPQDFRPDIPVGDLFTSLGFSKANQTVWRYDRTRALEWFLSELKSLPFSWVQDPWRLDPAPGEPVPTPSEAGPRPTRATRVVRDEPRPRGTVAK